MQRQQKAIHTAPYTGHAQAPTQVHRLPLECTGSHSSAHTATGAMLTIATAATTAVAAAAGAGIAAFKDITNI